MILELDHVQLAIPAGGEDNARAFYVEGLGMQEERKPEHLADRGGLWLSAGDVRLHLGVDPDFHPAKKAHPALLVEDLDSLRSQLERLGFHAAPDEPLEGYERTYVHDPFGNRIELMQKIHADD